MSRVDEFAIELTALMRKYRCTIEAGEAEAEGCLFVDMESDIVDDIKATPTVYGSGYYKLAGLENQ